MLVEIQNVTCFTEDGRMLFDRANLGLAGGERVLLTAPIASGKGLFIKLIAGMERPAAGTVKVFGEDVSALGVQGLNRLRKRIGFVVHDNILISNLKVIENVALPILYHAGLSYNESMRKAAELLSASGYKGSPWELPGPLPLYVKKAVAIARALALDPQIVICENLSEGLMPSELDHLTDVLIGYQEAGEGRLAIFTANPGADSAAIRASRTVSISEGRIVEGAGA